MKTGGNTRTGERKQMKEKPIFLLKNDFIEKFLHFIVSI